MSFEWDGSGHLAMTDPQEACNQLLDLIQSGVSITSDIFGSDVTRKVDQDLAQLEDANPVDYQNIRSLIARLVQVGTDENASDADHDTALREVVDAGAHVGCSVLALFDLYLNAYDDATGIYDSSSSDGDGPRSDAGCSGSGRMEEGE